MDPNDAGLLDLTDSEGAQIPFSAKRVHGTWLVYGPGVDGVDVGYITTAGAERVLRAMQISYASGELAGYREGVARGVEIAREVSVNDFSDAVLDRILADVKAHRPGRGVDR